MENSTNCQPSGTKFGQVLLFSAAGADLSEVITTSGTKIEKQQIVEVCRMVACLPVIPHSSYKDWNKMLHQGVWACTQRITADLQEHPLQKQTFSKNN